MATATKKNAGSEEEEKKKKRFLILSLILGAALVACIAAIVILLLSRNNGTGPVLEPDYPPVSAEPSAQPIESDDPGKLDAPQGGGSVALVYSDAVTLDTAAGTLTLYYQNPARSTQNVVLQVVLVRGEDEYLLAQSGLLEPGFMVSSLALSSDFKAHLSAGGYTGRFNLLFYDPDSGERAVVDTQIPITITVK